MKDRFSLQQMMRWFGPNDPVSLDHIAQAGCSGIVSALHSVPIGEIWTEEKIRSYKALIEAKRLSWTVVESLPVHEDIKTQGKDFKKYIENYKQSLVNLAKNGIKVVTYNFMPVLDWLRTDTAFRLTDGAETLLFNQVDYAIFDLFLLKRPNAENDYTPEEAKYLRKEYESLDTIKKEQLIKNILLALPGSDESFTLPEVKILIQSYKHIGGDQLKSNLIQFLKEICPIAEEFGIQLAIHPDDPPFSVFGLPRIMSTNEDVDDLMHAIPSTANGLCFCSGSFGVRPDNDLIKMIKSWGTKIYFVHLRNTRRDELGNFLEVPHLDGDTDMYAIMKALVHLMFEEKRSIPMRPDHGYKMLDDLGKSTYPGYSGIGRLKGLAELRGLELGIRKSFFNENLSDL